MQAGDASVEGRPQGWWPSLPAPCGGAAVGGVPENKLSSHLSASYHVCSVALKRPVFLAVFILTLWEQ